MQLILHLGPGVRAAEHMTGVYGSVSSHYQNVLSLSFLLSKIAVERSWFTVKFDNFLPRRAECKAHMHIAWRY